MPTIISLVLGDDLVPRLSFASMMRLRCEMLEAILATNQSKPELFIREMMSSGLTVLGIMCCGSTSLCQPGRECDISLASAVHREMRSSSGSDLEDYSDATSSSFGASS